MKNNIFITLFLITFLFSQHTLADTTSTNTKSISLFIESEIKGMVLDLKLNQPFGLAKDYSGNIYVADHGNDRLIKFNEKMKAKKEIGGFGASEGLLSGPTFISFDNGLNMIVADEKNQRLSRYNSKMNFVNTVEFYNPESPQQYGYPAGIAFTSYGEMWVSDREKNRLVIFNNQGKFDRYIGDFGDSGEQLFTPEKIVTTQSLDFIVCDAGNSRLVIYDNYGNFVNEIKSEYFVYPISAAVEKNMLWVLDGSTGELIYLDLNGKVITSFGSHIPGSITPLKEPSDFLFIESERILISDTGNNRLLICRIIENEF
jgi:DNA-binding beta-propeller fold protein YncE